jgi:hypothetical protein
MYAWIWRTLPGNVWVKLLLSLLLIAAVVYVLFTWVFPWAEPLLPFGDVTVDSGNVAPSNPSPGATSAGGGGLAG